MTIQVVMEVTGRKGRPMGLKRESRGAGNCLLITRVVELTDCAKLTISHLHVELAFMQSC